MWPIVFELGPLTIYSYGTMLAIGFLTASYLTSLELDRRGLSGDLSSNLLFAAAIGGLGGSRIWALVENWRQVLQDPIGVIFSGSGFVFYGGLIGGTMAVTFTMWRHHLPWLTTTDCIAPGLVLAQGIGRIGCQLAGDGDWGKVTDVAWGMSYPNAIVGWDYAPGVRVHPTPVYETIAYTIVFAILWSIRRRPFPAGTLFWLYLVMASGARFGIEFFRINPPALAGLSQAQLFSIVLILTGATALLLRAGSPPVPPPRRRTRERR